MARLANVLKTEVKQVAKKRKKTLKAVEKQIVKGGSKAVKSLRKDVQKIEARQRSIFN